MDQNIFFGLLNGKKTEIEYIEGTPGDLHGIVSDTHLMNSIFPQNISTELEYGISQMINWIYSIDAKKEK